MTRINLYPWRAEREQKNKQEYIALLIVICVMTFIYMLMLNWYYAYQIEYQTANNAYINEQVISTNKKLREIAHIKSQRQAILAGLSVLQQLNSDRNSTVVVINDILELINPLLVLDTISRTDHDLKITGYSESNAGVAKFLRALELSENFNSAELSQIKVIEDGAKGDIANNNYAQNGGFNNFFELKFKQNTGNTSQPEVEEPKTQDPLNKETQTKEPKKNV